MLVLLFQKSWVTLDSSFPSHPHLDRSSICKTRSEPDLTAMVSLCFLLIRGSLPLGMANLSVHLASLSSQPVLITAVRMSCSNMNSHHATVLIRTLQWLLVCLLSVNAQVLTMVYKPFMWLDLCHFSDLNSHYCHHCLFCPGHIYPLLLPVYIRHVSARRLLHWLSYLPGCSPPTCLHGHCPPSLHWKCIFSKGAILTTLFKMAIHPPPTHSAASFLSLRLFHYSPIAPITDTSSIRWSSS